MTRNPFTITITKKGQDYTACFHALSETQKNPEHLALYMIPPTGAFFSDPEAVKKELQKAGCESPELSPRLLPDYRRKDM